MLRSLTVVVALLLCAPALARTVDPKQASATTSSDALRQGLKQYDELEFEAALKLLEQALAEPTLTAEEKGVAGLYAGMVAHSLNEKDRGRADFDKAHDAMPDLELPEDAPPKIQLAFAEARKARKPLALKSTTPNVPEGGLEDPAHKPLVKQWWFWTGVGVVAVGATVAVILLTRTPDKAPGCGSAGNGCVDVTVPSGLWTFP